MLCSFTLIYCYCNVVVDMIEVWSRSKLISDLCILCFFVLDPLDIPLVVDISVLQPPPIATSGEIASASQVLPKGLVVRACWCALGAEPWVCPCANKWFRCRDENILKGMSRWFTSKTEIQK
jgi:hypothetical protein